MMLQKTQALSKRARVRLMLVALAAALGTGCQGKEEEGPEVAETPSAPTFVGRWKYESEAVNQECEGKELEHDPERGRTIDFVQRDGKLTLASETCRVPLDVNGSVAKSTTSSECPWVDGMTVTMSSVRAELRSKDRAQLVTETHILGTHPQFPDQAFDCTATSSGELTKVK